LSLGFFTLLFAIEKTLGAASRRGAIDSVRRESAHGVRACQRNSRQESAFIKKYFLRKNESAFSAFLSLPLIHFRFDLAIIASHRIQHPAINTAIRIRVAFIFRSISATTFLLDEVRRIRN
jgi:hypothetical protein